MFKDLYKLLEISPSAAPDKIKKAYRMAALKYHPDRTFNNKVLEDKFRQVRHAYEILSDEKRRRAYDITYSDNYRRQRKRPVAADNDGQKASITPAAYLKALRQLTVNTEKQKLPQVNQVALMAAINNLLPDKVIQSLKTHDDLRINREVNSLILRCSRKLNKANTAIIRSKLIRLAGTDNEALQLIYKTTESDIKVYFKKLRSSLIHAATSLPSRLSGFLELIKT